MSARRQGFSLVELVVAVLILSLVVLALGGVLPTSMRSTTMSRVDFLALNAADDRLTMIHLDPRFPRPEADWQETNTELDDLPGMTRSTTFELLEGGRIQRVTVRVAAPALRRAVERTIEIGEP